MTESIVNRYVEYHRQVRRETNVNTDLMVPCRFTGFVCIRPDRRKKPKGFIPPTPYQRYGELDDRYGIMNAYGSGIDSAGHSVYYAGVDDSNPCGSAFPSFDGGVANKAITQARLNLKGQRVNFAQAFAERKQTIDLVANTAIRVAAAGRAARKGNLPALWKSLGFTKNTRRVRKLAKGAKSGSQSDVHNLWLEHQFGWMPLLSDIYGSAQLLAERDTADPKRYEFHVKASALRKENQVTVATNRLLFYHLPCTSTDRQKDEYGAFVRFDMYLENKLLQNLSASGFTNPLSLAWELVPFSFVVDWMIPIGNYLNGLDAGVGWSFRAGSITQRVKSKRTLAISAYPVQPPPGWRQVAVGGFGTGDMYNVKRDVYSSFPLPSSVLPKNPLSVKHLASGLSLLAQAFR